MITSNDHPVTPPTDKPALERGLDVELATMAKIDHLLAAVNEGHGYEAVQRILAWLNGRWGQAATGEAGPF